MADSGRTIFGTSGSGFSVDGFQGEYASMSSSADLAVSVANNAYGINHMDLTPDEDITPGITWAERSSGGWQINESGLYQFEASVSFSGTGDPWERWAQISFPTVQTFQRPGGSAKLAALIPVDASVEPVTINLTFSSADTGDTITYAEFYAYKVA